MRAFIALLVLACVCVAGVRAQLVNCGQPNICECNVNCGGGGTDPECNHVAVMSATSCAPSGAPMPPSYMGCHSTGPGGGSGTCSAWKSTASQCSAGDLRYCEGSTYLCYGDQHRRPVFHSEDFPTHSFNTPYRLKVNGDYETLYPMPRVGEKCSYAFDLSDNLHHKDNSVVALDYNPRTIKGGSKIVVKDSVNEVDLRSHTSSLSPGPQYYSYYAASFSVTLAWEQSSTDAASYEGFKDARGQIRSFASVCGDNPKFMDVPPTGSFVSLMYPSRDTQDTGGLPTNGNARCLYTRRAARGYAIRWAFTSYTTLKSGASLDIVSGHVGELVVANNGLGYQNSDNVEKRFLGSASGPVHGTTDASMQTSFVLFNPNMVEHVHDIGDAIHMSYTSVQSCVDNELHHSDGT
jgi:hypothetical protein